MRALLVLCLLTFGATRAVGQDAARASDSEPGDPRPGPRAEPRPSDVAAADERDEDEPVYGARAEIEDPSFRASGRVGDEPERTEASSVVTRAEFDLRQPTSAPDALRWEPGVAVQQTSHGQASPYVRGLTGQQVVHLFDGVRLNNAIYRQGPNQYFFTVDERSLARLEVQRGSASVRYGSDALGGAILATPRPPPMGEPGFSARPRLYLRYGSADDERGGRAELLLGLGRRTGAIVGVGYREADLLRSGGVVRHRTPGGSGREGVAPYVPRFAEESAYPDDPSRWRTQLGTGFDEVTFDARLEHALAPSLRAVAAVYGYRQLDAPRTDQCPAPEAPIDECLRVARQFRTLAYGALRGEAGPMEELELVAYYQHHQEHRARDRPRSNVAFRFEDDVHSIGARFAAASPEFGADGAQLRLRYGADAVRDEVSSRARQRFTDLDLEFELSRGQYQSGSVYATLGAFAELELKALGWLTIRAGGRVAAIDASAPPDAESGSASVDRTFAAIVGRAGVEAEVRRGWKLALQVDQGFRAPNLDDLTARQQVGPGFQFENASLTPERSLTAQLGLVGDGERVHLGAWVFATRLEEAISRTVREAEDCPPATPDCLASRSLFQLVNADDRSRIFGGEGEVRLHLPKGISLRSTLTMTWGDGPDLTGAQGRVPLSRIPPPQGTFEARWRDLDLGLSFGAGLRWAAPQGRLAVADASDPRIPNGGTPGYAVVELRAQVRLSRWWTLGAVAENLGDVAYRVHGSSVLGAGRSARVWLRLGE